MIDRAEVSVVAFLARYLELSPVASVVTGGPTHAIRFANIAFRQLQADGEIAIGESPAGSERQPTDLTPLLNRAFHGHEVIYDELLASGRNAVGPWSCSVWPIVAPVEGSDGLVLEVRDAASLKTTSPHQRAMTERLLLGALREQDAARYANEASRRATFLASASRELAMSLDEDTTRDIVRRRSLPREGSWCIVDVVEADGSVHRLAAVHPDPAKAGLARTLADRWFPSASQNQSLQSEAMRRAEPVVIPHNARARLLAAARGSENVQTLRSIGFDALLVVPLILRGTAIGAITFVTGEGGPPISTEEIAIGSNIADLCAIALGNARLFGETDALRAAADVANRAKSAFLGSMSHELRTPLNVIGGYLDLIAMGLRGAVTPEQRADFARMKLNQEHLMALISEILTFVGSESGQLRYHFTDVLLRPALIDVAEMLDPVVKQRQLTLELRQGEVGAAVWADPIRLRQILMNLVANAVKYTPVGGGVITLSVAVTPDAAIIQVIDRGSGIPVDKHQTIFEPFVQLTTALSERQSGVGLGLAISRDLARAMSGDVTVESTVGVGSRFTLELPRAKPTPLAR